MKTKEELNKLAQIRHHFYDYIECLGLIFAKMPENASNFFLTDEHDLICSQLDELGIREIVEGSKFSKNGFSDPLKIGVIIGVDWYAIECDGSFYLYNEGLTKAYYLSIF